MPSSSTKQANMMRAVAHNPKFAKKVGIPQSVGRDFARADGNYAEGGRVQDDDSWLHPVAMKDGGYVKPSKFKVAGQEHEAAPLKPMEAATSNYLKFINKEPTIFERYPEFDESRAAKIAQAYEEMQHAPTDPRVKRAYDAMIEETLGQYHHLKDAGYDFQFIKPGEGDPYAASPAMGYLDLRDRGRLSVFPTDAGFGTLGELDTSANPLLKRVGKIGDLDNATANDAFRIVHDMYGHFGPGNPFFRHKGEERAWLHHSGMYSPEALPAMTSETRGQNSWLNFGPFGERNRNASSADTVYADQKSGLMPDWTHEYAGGGKVKFVDQLAPQFKGQLDRGADMVREHTEKTGKEGLTFGDEFGHAPLIRGHQTGIHEANTFVRFVDEMRNRSNPFFSIHSHPVISTDPLTMRFREVGVAPDFSADFMRREQVPGALNPSATDLRTLQLSHPSLHTLGIAAAGTPHANMTLNGDGPALGQGVNLLQLRQFSRPETLRRMVDVNEQLGMHPADHSGYAMMVNDKLANLGLDVQMDKRAAASGGVRYEDLLPEFKGYLQRHNAYPFAEGGRA